MRPTFVALDLETTGLDPEQDEIIEIGVVRFQSDGHIETWSTLVNPGRPLPPRIEQLTGISSDEVAQAPTLPMVLPTLRRFVGDAILIGHNVAFDLNFLHRVHLFEGHRAIDTFALASIILPRQPSYALGALAETLGVSLNDAHRALADARAAAELFLALIRYAEIHIPPEVIRRINHFAQRCQEPWPLHEVFQEIERRQARHAFVRQNPRPQRDLSLDVEELEPFIARPPERPPDQPLDVERLAGMLAPDGEIASAFPGYEYRPQQVEMLRAVAKAFNEGGHLLVEAGTGTGKSLAYLLPAIRFALDNQERVVISTNTINLQDQLFNKDIPDLQRLLGVEARCAILKGRSNYLCLRRFEALCRTPNLTVDEMDVIARVLVWLTFTTTGDQAELFLPSATHRAIWGRIASDSLGCMAERCPHRRRGRCFFHQAHKRAQNAHLIIVNHALLLSDVATENRVLPEYTHLIIDEAHHLEEATTKQLGFTVSAEGIFHLLRSLRSTGQRPGLLTEVLLRVRPAVEPERRSAVQARVQAAQGAVQVAYTATDLFFNAVRDFLGEHVRQRLDGPYDVRVLLDSGMRHQPAWSDLEIIWDEASERFTALIEQLADLSEYLDSLSEYEIAGLDELTNELMAAAHHLAEQRDQIEAIICSPHTNGIYWAEVSAQSGQLSLKAVPLHVGPLVEQHLLRPKRTVIMTSATLRTAGRFDYIRERLHLWEAEELAVGSPFDFESQALVYIPTDVPEPNQTGYQDMVERAIVELARAAEGRLLALFTSYSQLRRTTEAISQILVPEGFAIFSQGDGSSRVQLLHGFRTTPKAVLLGTRSFWEGVDIVGEALSVLVIARLPFAVPNDPIIQARSRTFDDPFNEYYLPDAILRFRQGFGRLIRSRNDIGVCVILDRRVLSKSYGELFLKSLPACYTLQGPLAHLPRLTAQWLSRGRGS